MTAEGYSAAGSTATISQNFQSYSNVGVIIGTTTDTSFDNASGLEYALFNTASIAAIPPTGGTLTLTPPDGPVIVTVPTGAFPSPVTITISTPNFTPACKPPLGQTFTPISEVVEIDATIEPVKPVEVSISYVKANPTVTPESTFFIARCDLGVGVWLPLISNSDIADELVTAETDRFSYFQIFNASLPSTVKNVAISDNPIMPSRGVPTATFSNLPANTRLRIYTISGLLVKNLMTDASGMATWDATNQSGRQVASGVYFVFAQGAGTTKTFKIAVQR